MSQVSPLGSGRLEVVAGVCQGCKRWLAVAARDERDPRLCPRCAERLRAERLRKVKDEDVQAEITDCRFRAVWLDTAL